MKVGAINPVTGSKIPMNLGSIGGYLLGALFLMGIYATTQNIGKAVTDRVNNKYVDFVPNSNTSGEVKIVDSVAVYG